MSSLYRNYQTINDYVHKIVMICHNSDCYVNTLSLGALGQVILVEFPYLMLIIVKNPTLRLILQAQHVINAYHSWCH